MTERDEHSAAERVIGFTDREAEVIKTSRFYDLYKDDLQELFSALGLEKIWSDNPIDFHDYIQRAWVGQEHGNAVEKEQYSDEQVAAAMPVLERMNLTSEALPHPGEKYDQTIVVGGTTPANYRRMQLTSKAREQGVELGEEIWLVGQRPREARDGTNEELLGTDGRFAGHDITKNPSIEGRMKTGAFDGEVGTDSAWSLTETDTAIISLLKVVDPEATPHRIGLHLVDLNAPKDKQHWPGQRPDAPARLVTDYRYTLEDGHDITLINAEAVQRGTSEKPHPSRHTTQSATQEWLERHAPKKNAKVLYVTGNPHSLRTTQDTQRILDKLGRGDIQLELAGTTPAVGAPIQTILGEVGRLVHNDLKYYRHEIEE